jgi:phage/plasmid primase-like uncharacterized protein
MLRAGAVDVTEPRGRIPDHVLEEIRAALSLADVVQRMTTLKRSGRSMCGPCPIHNGRSSALHVYPDKRNFHCFSCGAHGDVFRWVMLTEGCDFRQAALRCAADAGVALEGDPGERRRKAPPPRDHAAEAEREAAKKRARAAETWSQSWPIEEGSPQQKYLAGRGLWPLPEAARLVLRAASIRYPADRDSAGKVVAYPAGRELHPVMLARVSAPGIVVTGVHVTFLAPREDGSVGKLAFPVDDTVHKAKQTWGDFRPGAAIRLADPAERMGVAEGIETALAASRLFDGLAVWSAISAGGMERFATPRCCRELLIFADRDKPRTERVWQPEGAGMHSARHLHAASAARGVPARIMLPRAPFGDFADVLVGMGRAA